MTGPNGSTANSQSVNAAHNPQDKAKKSGLVRIAKAFLNKVGLIPGIRVVSSPSPRQAATATQSSNKSSDSFQLAGRRNFFDNDLSDSSDGNASHPSIQAPRDSDNNGNNSLATSSTPQTAVLLNGKLTDFWEQGNSRGNIDSSANDAQNGANTVIPSTQQLAVAEDTSSDVEPPNAPATQQRQLEEQAASTSHQIEAKPQIQQANLVKHVADILNPLLKNATLGNNNFFSYLLDAFNNYWKHDKDPKDLLQRTVNTIEKNINIILKGQYPNIEKCDRKKFAYGYAQLIKEILYSETGIQHTHEHFKTGLDEMRGMACRALELKPLFKEIEQAAKNYTTSIPCSAEVARSSSRTTIEGLNQQWQVLITDYRKERSRQQQLPRNALFCISNSKTIIQNHFVLCNLASNQLKLCDGFQGIANKMIKNGEKLENAYYEYKDVERQMNLAKSVEQLKKEISCAENNNREIKSECEQLIKEINKFKYLKYADSLVKNFNSKKEHYNTRVRKFAAAIESGITEHQRIAHNSPEQVKDTHDRRKLIEESVEKLIGKMEELRQANAGRIPSELSLEDVQEVERLSENVDCLSDYAACGAQDKRTEGRNQRFLTPNYVRTEKGDISTPVSSGTEPRLDMHSTQRAENQQLQKQEETKRMVIGGLVAAAGAITIGLGATALVATTAATGGIVLVVLGVGLFCFGLWYANRENKPGVFTRLGNGIQTGINGLKNGINGGRQARQIEREDWNSHHKVL